jgi:hypothetical protein
VGDTYTYTATARLADGSVVVRPISWSIAESDRGAMTLGGVLVPLKTGVITLIATIDGDDWTGTTTAYDWADLSSGGAIRVALRSESQITNQFGTSENPNLVLSCTPEGYLFVYVLTSSFVTKNGQVGYFFDSGPNIFQTWNETPPSYRSLFHPGPTNLQVRSFAITLASARRFGFAFTEFLSTAKGVAFRVTGLNAIVGPLLSACPSNSLLMAGSDLRQDMLQLQAAAQVNPGLAAMSGLRQQAGSQPSAPPSLVGLHQAAVDSQVAARRP